MTSRSIASNVPAAGVLRRHPATAGTAVLMVSNTGTEEEALAAFDAGVDDWLVALHTREFRARLNGLLGRCRRHPHHDQLEV